LISRDDKLAVSMPNTLQNIYDDGEAFRQAVLAGAAYKPIYVKMKLVWVCNLRCVMCNHWREHRGSSLDTATLLRVIDELADMGCRKIHLSGGEPTLRRDLEELIARMTGYGIRVSMTTNGTLLSKERSATLAEAGLSAVNISIDSPDPHIHDKIRGLKGSWKETVRGLRNLRKTLKHGKVRINTVVGQRNYRSLPEFASGLKADSINLIPVDNHELVPIETQTVWLRRLSGTQIHEYNTEIAPKLAEQALTLGLIRHPYDAYPFGLTPESIQLSTRGNYAQGYYAANPCFAPWMHTMINHDGRVVVCCMLREEPIMGDLRQQSFREIWNGAQYAALRSTGGINMHSTCHQCDMFLKQNQHLDALVKDQLNSLNESSRSGSLNAALSAAEKDIDE
jgi:radical SAM protein with 4Fe4S-binding SPASM domain